MGDSGTDNAVRRLREKAEEIETTPGRKCRTVGDALIRREASRLLGLSETFSGCPEEDPAGPQARLVEAKRAIELALLSGGIVPRRYARNMGTIGLQGQERLLRATVGVAGLGGLGGFVAEFLARAGVGRLVLVDPDEASDDNLNRQLLATEEKVGQSKTALARERLAGVNSATAVTTHRLRATEDDFARVFSGASVLVDALDTVPARFDLAAASRRLGIPLVHGAIEGLSGQATTIYPGDPGLEAFYGRPGRGAPPYPGCPAGSPPPTPAIIAAVEALEAMKVITGVGRPLRGKLLVLDLMTLYAAVVDL